MQYVNNDMDEVFRKAAEHYPLDTRSSDWNKVLAALEKKEPEPLPARKDNHYKRLLWLLLLLPLYLICNRPAGISDKAGTGVVKSNETPLVHQGQDPEANDRERNTSGINKPVQESIPASSQENKSLEEGTVKEKQLNSGASELQGKKIKSLAPTLKNRKSTKAGQIPVASNIEQVVLSSKKAGAENKLSVLKTRIQKNNEEAGKQANNIEGVRTNQETEPIGRVQEQPFRSSFTPHVDGASRERRELTWEFQHQDVAGSASMKEPSVKKQRLYLGLMGGIDRTTIKNQKADDMGYDYGGLIGYELGRKWSVEAAVFMDQKSYYTNGKYLTTSKVYRPANSEITDVTGTCRMYDISLGVKYNLRQTSRSSLFAAAGISSYFMKKEDYSYTYYYPMTGMVYIHEATYKNESRNILSIANISVGYTHQLGKIAQIRIEPYVKIPVRGVGFGELPLFSTGIRAGFVRKLF